jgi:hypothetical protein
MDRGFGLGKPLEHRLGAIANGYRQRRSVDQREDFLKAPMSVMMDVLGGSSNVLGGFSNVLGGLSNGLVRVLVNDELCR